MRPQINIISRSNGVGLDQDARLIKSCLEAAGMTVTLSHCRSIPVWSRFIPSQPKFDANIFLERTFQRWFKTSKINLLIPNQERYPRRHLKKLKHIDSVLCKSQHAFEIFSQFTDAQFIGFSSPDRSIESIHPDYQSFIHLAGKSTLKGTETLLDLWEKHPEWPILTLIQHHSNAPEQTPNNVKLISEYLSNEKLTDLLNTHGLHLCTSRSEGWGHYIVEAMSCSAFVITTDAPPMNELVTPARGALVPFKTSEARHLGTNFYVDADALEAQIKQIMLLTESVKSQRGSAARQWFDQNHHDFEIRLQQCISKILMANY